jgi:hypothetical protein
MSPTYVEVIQKVVRTELTLHMLQTLEKHEYINAISYSEITSSGFCSVSDHRLLSVAP